MTFTPELGQAAFSNTEWQRYELDGLGQSLLETLAIAIAEARGEDQWKDGLLVSNYGCDPFENDVFAMRTYCWCGGDRHGHEDGCPPNFEHKASGLTVCWYKHVGRGASKNQPLNRGQWLAILRDCLESL
jgi:hypothetical protein